MYSITMASMDPCTEENPRVIMAHSGVSTVLRVVRTRIRQSFLPFLCQLNEVRYKFACPYHDCIGYYCQPFETSYDIHAACRPDTLDVLCVSNTSLVYA